MYADSHEWVKVDGGLATVGITDHAQVTVSFCSFINFTDIFPSVSGTLEMVMSTKKKHGQIHLVFTIEFMEFVLNQSTVSKPMIAT